MKQIVLIAGVLLLGPAVANAGCIQAVKMGNNYGFYNGCEDRVIVGYTSDYVGKGTVGPISPGQKEMTATPLGQKISWKGCLIRDWSTNACSVN